MQNPWFKKSHQPFTAKAAAIGPGPATVHRQGIPFHNHGIERFNKFRRNAAPGHVAVQRIRAIHVLASPAAAAEDITEEGGLTILVPGRDSPHGSRIGRARNGVGQRPSQGAKAKFGKTKQGKGAARGGSGILGGQHASLG